MSAPKDYGKAWQDIAENWYWEAFYQAPGIHLNFINFLLEKNDATTVLEIGCGPGIYPIHYKKLFEGKKYCGIDLSHSAIDFAKNNSNFEFRCEDFLKNNYQKYDLVFSHMVIDHIYDVELFISKIVRATEKYAYVSAYNGYYPEMKEHESYYEEEKGVYFTKLAPKLIRNTLEKNGLTDNEFVIRPQRSGNIIHNIDKATIIEIKKQKCLNE